MARLTTLLPLALSGLILAAPELASACNPRTICVQWTPTITDNDVGEVYLLEDRFPARGTRVMLMRPVPEPPLHTFLDQEGCLTFDSQFAYGHKLVVYGDAWVGNPPINLRVARQADQDGEYTTDFFWVVDVTEIAPNAVVDVTFEWQETDPVVPIMAVATEVLHRFHELNILPPPTAPLVIVFRDWFGGAAYYGTLPELSDSKVIHLGPDSYQEKYVIAHEMGHWLQREWKAHLGGGGYDYGNKGQPKAPDPPCEFSTNQAYHFNGKDKIFTYANLHGLRSAEWSRAALKEGFAHFIAAIAFNDSTTADADGIFRYYKDIRNDDDWDYYNDFLAANSRVSLFGGDDTALGGGNHWTAYMCTGDWNQEGVSSEIDWLRFFWHFLTRSGPRPTPRQILEFLAWVVEEVENYQTSETDVWCPLMNALGQSQWASFADRFDEANDDMGVYNGNAQSCL